MNFSYFHNLNHTLFMKKIALIGALFMALAHQSYAILGLFKIGPEVGMNMSNMKADFPGLTGGLPVTFDTKSLTGLRAGLTADVHLFKPIYLQVGALYTQQGTNLEANVLGFTVDGKMKVNYIQVPVSILYKKDLVVGKVFVGAGPYWGYAMNGTFSFTDPTTGTKDEEDITFGDSSGDMKRMDVGIGFNAGFQLKFGPFIRFQYQLGLTELSSDASVLTAKNRAFSVSVGWLF